MIRFAACLALLALAASASAEDGPPRRRGLTHGSYANPSAIVEAELAFARLAREKGQWTAFAKTAAAEAVLFVPQRVNALAWLRHRPNPPVAVQWQPYDVWMSCDGSIGLSRGSWSGPNGTGYFTTLWKRQKDGSYKWVLDQGDTLPQPLAAPEMLSGNIADCRPAATATAAPVPAGVDAQNGASHDRSLQWSSWAWPDGKREVKVWLWNGAGFDQVVDSTVATPHPG